MLSNLFIGLVFGTASIVTTSASPTNHANRDNGIACMSGGAPLAAGFDDCEGVYDWLENSKDQSVGTGKKGHRWWLSDTVQVRLDETWHSSCAGHVTFNQVASAMKAVMEKCQHGSQVGGEVVLTPKGQCGSTLFVGKESGQ